MAATTVPLSLPAQVEHTVARAPATPGIGVHGWLLALAALSLGGSAIPGLRVEVAGMLVHPVNFAVALVFIVAAPRRLATIPQRVGIAMFAFCAIFILSAALRDRSTTTIVKLSASMFTLLAGAIAVQNERAFRIASLGFSIAIGFVSFRSLMGSPHGLGGINPMQGIANENAFSLYAVPSLMISSYLALQTSTPRFQRVIFGVSSVLAVMALFSTANRSGWLCAIVVSGLLSLRAMRRAKTFLVLGALVAGAAYLVIEYGNMTLIELNIRITEEGYASDRLRWQLILAALDTGLSNPILGVSPQRLPVELGRYVGISGRGIDAHNVLGLIFGGTGFLGFFSFLAFGYAMFFRNKLAQISARANEAHFLLRCMIVVWFTRAMFSGEIIFSPSFSLALGMAIGLCVATGVWQRPQRIVSPRMAFGRQASRVRAA